MPEDQSTPPPPTRNPAPHEELGGPQDKPTEKEEVEKITVEDTEPLKKASPSEQAPVEEALPPTEQAPVEEALPPTGQALPTEQAPVEEEIKTSAPKEVLTTTAPAADTASPPLEQAPKPGPVKTKPVASFAKQFLDHMKGMRKKANEKRAEKKARNLELIMKESWKTERITNDDVERVIGVSDRQALNYLKILVKKGKLMRFGKKKGVYYKPLR